MVYIVEPHSEEALAVLQNLASLNVLTLKPLNGNAASTVAPDIPTPASSQKIQPIKDDLRQTTQNQSKPAFKPAKKRLSHFGKNHWPEAFPPKPHRKCANTSKPSVTNENTYVINAVVNPHDIT